MPCAAALLCQPSSLGRSAVHGQDWRSWGEVEHALTKAHPALALYTPYLTILSARLASPKVQAHTLRRLLSAPATVTSPPHLHFAAHLALIHIHASATDHTPSALQNSGNGFNRLKLRIPMERRYYADTDAVVAWPPQVQDYNKRFTRALETINSRHDPTVTTVAQGVAQGVLEWKRVQNARNIGLDIQAWLDRFYMTRIGIRFLIGQHVALNTQQAHEGYVGIICTKAPPPPTENPGARPLHIQGTLPRVSIPYDNIYDSHHFRSTFPPTAALRPNGLEWKVWLCLLVAVAAESSAVGTEGVRVKQLVRDGPRGEWGSSWCAFLTFPKRVE
ncbi:hypothetical protein D9615_010292 [Tricholomella constricta]|uniref:Protein-serine/threonine kinase n=1 Tax=Tricholomella constricta TaxID=117010 RepID=A0A8H5GMH0_9AGAR|nr:hypothetical protein D9615_010292 [Tricholomella constricta]